jgi:hypothetical protein
MVDHQHCSGCCGFLEHSIIAQLEYRPEKNGVIRGDGAGFQRWVTGGGTGDWKVAFTRRQECLRYGPLSVPCFRALPIVIRALAFSFQPSALF